MSSISIPWHNGAGNIILTYSGQGSDSVSVTSDTDNTTGGERRQKVTFVITNGIIREYPVSSEGHRLVTSDGHIITCLKGSMKVSVEVVQNGSILYINNINE